MPASLLLRAALPVVVLCTPVCAVQLLQFNLPYVETFDTLATTGTSAVLPDGWSLREVGSGANSTYAVGTGSSSTGNTYSFGSPGSTDRALGTLRSSSVAAMFGMWVVNRTGAIVDELLIAYTGEQWRLGAVGRMDRLEFSYSRDAADLGTGTWTEVSELGFTAPVTTGSVGALNGNAAGQRVEIAHGLGSLGLAAGEGLMLRWLDVDAVGADDGLAVDDFSIVAVQAAPPAVPETLPVGFTSFFVSGLVLLATRRRR